MTWSMYSIGFIQLADFNKADEHFRPSYQNYVRHSYQNYVRPPFNVWTETQSGIGTVNFITGIGGFLQAVIFGYGGIRLQLNQLEFNPYGHLPDQTNKLIFHGIKYQGFTLDLTINNTIYEIFANSQNNNTLLYEHGEDRGVLKPNDHLSFPINTLLIIRPSIPFCS